MAYPSTFSAFNRPTASDKLNSPSHADLHNTVSSALGQVEAVIGLSGDSSTLGTIIGDLRSPASNGGGHIQTANKGGTGQTSYSKGDILIATSSSVLTKLAVSSVQGDVLTAAPAQATGVSWSQALGTKVAITSVGATISASSIETVVFSASVSGSILATGRAIEFDIPISYLGINNTDSFTMRVKYGNNTALQVGAVQAGTATSLFGAFKGAIIANGSDSLQKSYGHIVAMAEGGGTATSIFSTFNTGTSSVSSLVEQDIVITGQFSSSNGSNKFSTPFGVMFKVT